VRKTKLTVLLLAALMAAQLLTGCKDKEKDKETGAGKEKLKAVTLKLYYPGSPQKDQALVNDEINKYLTEKINATLEMNPVDWANWPQKVNTMLSANEDFDLTLTASWCGFYENIAKKGYTDITDLVDKHAPKLRKELPPSLFKGATVNGKLYGIPTYKEMADVVGVRFIANKDLVDKHKIDIDAIEKVEDLEPILKLIKENEPDYVPLAWGQLPAIADTGYEDVGPWDSIGKFKDGKIVDAFDDPEYVKLFDIARKWYLAGYIQQDVLTATNDPANLFMKWQPLKPGKDKEMSLNEGKNWIQPKIRKAKIMTGVLSGSIMAIPRSSKNVERALMYLELVNTDKYLNNLINFGIEGKHYVKVSDNIIDYAPGVDTKSLAYAPGGQWFFGNQFLNYVWKSEDPNKWKNFEEFNKVAVPSDILGFVFNPDPVKTELAASSNIFKEFFKSLESGAVDPKVQLPKFREKLKQAGSDRILAEKQKQYEEWKKIK
jgi:putative aldouronate transport system substrate-binding protein